MEVINITLWYIYTGKLSGELAESLVPIKYRVKVYKAGLQAESELQIPESLIQLFV